MKHRRVLTASLLTMLALLLLAGCGNKPSARVSASPSPAGGSNMKTYTSARYGYAFTYDSAGFTLHINQTATDKGASGEQAWLSSRQDTHVAPFAVNALPLANGSVAARRAGLRTFFTDPDMKGLKVAVGPLHLIKMNGLPTLTASWAAAGTAMKGTVLDLWKGGFDYELWLQASPKMWPTLQPTLMAVVRSFRVTR